jgi:hypothetical protein
MTIIYPSPIPDSNVERIALGIIVVVGIFGLGFPFVKSRIIP